MSTISIAPENTLPLEDKRSRAQELFFNTNLNQSQIAELLQVNRKTLYCWMKEGDWVRIRACVSHTPYMLAEQYSSQLAALNRDIAQRDNPWPTREEAEIIRKTSMTLRYVKGNRRIVSDSIELFSMFVHHLRKKDLPLTKQFMPHLDEYIKSLTHKSNAFDPIGESREDKEIEQEFQEWLASHPSEMPYIETNPTPDSPSSPAVAFREGGSPTEASSDDGATQLGTPPSSLLNSPTSPLQQGANGVQFNDQKPPEPAPTQQNNKNQNVDKQNNYDGVQPSPHLILNRAQRRAIERRNGKKLE